MEEKLFSIWSWSLQNNNDYCKLTFYFPDTYNTYIKKNIIMMIKSRVWKYWHIVRLWGSLYPFSEFSVILHVYVCVYVEILLRFHVHSVRFGCFYDYVGMYARVWVKTIVPKLCFRPRSYLLNILQALVIQTVYIFVLQEIDQRV